MRTVTPAFTAASLLCASAPNIESLIAFRLLQGTAGAMPLPQGLGLLRENFAGPELTRVLAIFGPVLGLGGIIGPVLGGFLIEGDFFDLGWRSVFLINLPIGVAAMIVAAKFVPKKAGDRALRVAVFGSVFFAQAKTGAFIDGFHRALIVQACLLVVFLAITFLLPKKGRPEEEQHGGITPEATADGSGAKQHLTV
ncbi:MFS transporter [Phytomonospora sp. NPDC050363]|uniref:MFS transporter n=1 Tax=Phytomonospora sp. NPDC050363 TaxID=3155642 RepID=UPI00340D8FCD